MPGTESDEPVIMPPGIIIPPVKPQSGIAEDNELAHPYPSDREMAHPPPRAALTQIQGPFRVLRVLQAGGFATAVAVEDVASQRLLCVKVFRKDRLKHNRTAEGLLKELEVYRHIATSKHCVGHMFIMQLEMSFRTNDYICFVMPLMANDLLYYIMTQPAYTHVHACRWSAQIALGINALHGMGIMHRDIKVENVLIDSSENVKIGDFGLSYTHPEPLNRFQELFLGREGNYPVHGARDPVQQEKTRFYKVRNRRGLVGIRPLFATAEDVTDYISWHSSNYGTIKSFPAFGELDPLVVSLVAGLLRPEAIFRSGFRSIQKHPWFFSNAARRKEWPHMLPDLKSPDGECQQPEYLTPLPADPSGHRSKCTLDVDWRNPKSGVVSF
ncbi:kinase-like domain-containing protein [Suillus ampliporus]|nr:kinase-like domain-containing protein [Suillus ampliporus]